MTIPPDLDHNFIGLMKAAIADFLLFADDLFVLYLSFSAIKQINEQIC